LDDMGQLFESLRFSDVTLSVGDQQFHAHKALLAARSPVFAAMFEHNMEETKQNRVDITDVDHEVLREMLRFIYTGKVNNMEKMAKELLAVADKYAVEQLKMMCAEGLRAKLSIKNAADVLILADLHTVEHLQAQTINFICTRAVAVMKKPKWKSMITSHPHLIAEVASALASQLVCHDDDDDSDNNDDKDDDEDSKKSD